MFTKSISHTASLIALTFSAGHLTGCGNPGWVQGNAEVASFGQASHLMGVTRVDGNYVDGTCLDPAATGMKRANGSGWQAAVSAMQGTQPQVVQNDPTCQLAFATLQVKDSTGANATAMTMTPITLTASYPASPAVFTYTDTDPAVGVQNFYASANITPATFATNFAISVVYSANADSLTMATTNGGGQYSTVSTNSVSATNVLTPNYTLSFANDTYTFDGTGLVTSDPSKVTGPALVAVTGTTLGQNYVTLTTSCPALTLAAVSGAYMNPTPISTLITNANLGLVTGTQLPHQGCIIVANCDPMATGVCSYQLFDVTFSQ